MLRALRSDSVRGIRHNFSKSRKSKKKQEKKEKKESRKSSNSRKSRKSRKNMVQIDRVKKTGQKEGLKQTGLNGRVK